MGAVDSGGGALHGPRRQVVFPLVGLKFQVDASVRHRAWIMSSAHLV
jgi:hypothetical protein